MTDTEQPLTTDTEQPTPLILTEDEELHWIDLVKKSHPSLNNITPAVMAADAMIRALRLRTETPARPEFG